MPRLQFQPAARYAFATEMPIEPGQINEGGHLDNVQLLALVSVARTRFFAWLGYSVLDVVRAYAAARGRDVPYRVVPRRPGDVAACYAEPVKALETLGWRAERGLQQMCDDAWRWQQGNLRLSRILAPVRAAHCKARDTQAVPEGRSRINFSFNPARLGCIHVEHLRHLRPLRCPQKQQRRRVSRVATGI